MDAELWMLLITVNMLFIYSVFFSDYSVIQVCVFILKLCITNLC